MYGMIPKAKMEAWEKAPPENISRSCIRPEEENSLSLVRSSGLIPGSTT